MMHIITYCSIVIIYYDVVMIKVESDQVETELTRYS